MLEEGLVLGLTQEQPTVEVGISAKNLPVLTFTSLESLSFSGGGHDIWGNLDEDEVDFRGIREQETEVILAFTLLITILLTFIG